MKFDQERTLATIFETEQKIPETDSPLAVCLAFCSKNNGAALSGKSPKGYAKRFKQA